jgi:hypothetical protein
VLQQHGDPLSVEENEALVTLLQRDFGGDAAVAALSFTKVPAPLEFRWGTIGATACWTLRWLDLLRIVLAWFWKRAPTVPTGSDAAIALQWCQWSNSPKIRAQLALLVEWVGLFEPLWMALNSPMPYGDEAHFGAPFLLRHYCSIEAILIKLEQEPAAVLPSYTALREAHADEPSAPLRAVGMLASVGLRTLDLNANWVFEAVHVLGAFADPEMTASVWEALSHQWQYSEAPTGRTDFGTLVHDWLFRETTSAQQAYMGELMTTDFLRGLHALVCVLETDGREAFMEALRTGCSPVATYFQQFVFPAVTGNVRLEATFSLHDLIATAHHGLRKAGASDNLGSSGRDETIPSLLVVREALASTRTSISHAWLLQRNATHVHGRSQARSVAVAVQLVSVAPSKDAYVASRPKRSGHRRRPSTSRGGVSPADSARLQQYQDSGAERRSLQALATGADVAVRLVPLCFSDGTKCLKDNRKERGRQRYVWCRGCGHQFHRGCAVEAGILIFTEATTEVAHTPTAASKKRATASKEGIDAVWWRCW